MLSLGFINQVSKQVTATKTCLESIRSFYPNAPVVFSVDGAENYTNYTEMLPSKNVEWIFNEEKLGYPPYNKEQILECLKRLYIGTIKLNTDFFMMVEDDLLFLNPIQLNPEWECVGHVIEHGNKIPEHLLYSMQNYTGKIIWTDYYGCGGGSIFKTKTFIENYANITAYIEKKWWIFEADYSPQCGYTDCFLTLYFMLCGEPYTPNLRMLNLDPHSEEGNRESFYGIEQELVEKYSQNYDLIHNFKRYYKR